ncbi:MAG: hypothetical protein WCX76_01720 [Candidatus Methanomethylophilaceae archaeon]|jgi:hypothetical protein|nr:hypothetical protein [Candidatus Methanomethylophilaceae archaeon]
MELQVLECPYCRGNVRMDPDHGSGVCANCGKSIIVKEYGEMQSRILEDRRSSYEKVVQAKNLLEAKRNPLGRDGRIRELIDSAMALDSGSPDGWYLNAAFTMCESGRWDGTSDNMVSRARELEKNRKAKYFTYEDCMNVRKEAEQVTNRIGRGMSGVFALVTVFFGLFFLGIPAILYLAGIMPLFVVGIMAGMFAFMAIAVFFALRVSRIEV